MKIKEAVNTINNTTETTVAKVLADDLLIFRRNDFINWFLSVPIKAMTWRSVEGGWIFLDDVYPADLARVMDVIQRLLDTPVEERFPEKKYRLVANPNSFEQTGTYATKYVACIQDGMDCFSFVYGGPTVFSEKELKQIEELHPNIAPAIDTMKEEVKDDEAD